MKISQQNKIGVWALNSLLVLALFPLTAAKGCQTNQATISALVATLGNSAAAIASLEGNTVLAQQLQTDTAAAADAVLNWKPGTPSQNAVQLLQIVQKDLSLFPINSQYAALINIALGTATAIIVIVNNGNQPQVPESDAVSGPRPRSVFLANPPKNADEYKKQWNAIVAQNPALARAAIQ